MTTGGPTAAVLIGGRYEIVARIGAGANGEVYLADDTYQQERVAIKLLSSGPTGVWGEAAILTGLRDDHILPVRNADLHLGQPYLVTALAANGTLESATPLGTGVAPDQAVLWTRQICRGAARTHDAGLLHTDIKPGNAFLDDAGHALLGDFGLACIPDPATGKGHNYGTPETMAPEVAASYLTAPGGPGATVASDVYSLAATLYFLLAGRFAHERDASDPDGTDCIARVATEPGPGLADTAPHVPRGLRQRVEQAMSHDPRDRPTTASAFAAALGDWPRPTRSWRRTDEHRPAHTGCWRGTRPGAAEFICCAVPTGRGFDIETRSPSGRRITAACTTAPGPTALPLAVRRALRSAT